MNHRDHDRKRLNRVEDVYDEHLDGDAPDAHVIAYGQTAETCGHEANILKQKSTQVQRDPVCGAVFPEAWPPSMPNIGTARPETGSLAD